MKEFTGNRPVAQASLLSLKSLSSDPFPTEDLVPAYAGPSLVKGLVPALVAGERPYEAPVGLSFWRSPFPFLLFLSPLP